MSAVGRTPRSDGEALLRSDSHIRRTGHAHWRRRDSSRSPRGLFRTLAAWSLEAPCAISVRFGTKPEIRVAGIVERCCEQIRGKALRVVFPEGGDERIVA